MVMCGPLAGVSGGDTHALRFVAAWERDRPGTVSLIAPPSTAEYLPHATRQTMLALRTPLDARLCNLGVYSVAVILRTILATMRMPSTRIAVASSHFFYDVIPCVVARRRQGALVGAFVYHVIADMDRDRTLRSALSRLGERFALWMLRRWGDIVFVNNEDVAGSLRRRGFASDRVVMTGNAFDPLVPLPPRVNGGPPVLAFCGRLVEEKGIWDILELGRALAATVPSARIDMIGAGPLREAFSRRLSVSGLDNIRMLGFVSEEDKWALLRSATLFVAPSREEGWGIAVGEALTAGTPVLAYDLPAYRYLGDSIERVPTGDTPAFVSTAEQLVRDPELLARQQRTVEAVAGRLPRWDDVLAAEFAALREHLREPTCSNESRVAEPMTAGLKPNGDGLKPNGDGTVSVIVPTRNSARTISACLRSIREQTYGAVELIVVDNHSTDGTAQLAAAVADTIVTAGPERSAQRNIGARASSGDYLFFVDSDMVLEPTVIAECLRSALAVHAVVVPEVSFGDGFWARCKAFERSCYVGDDSVEAARFFSRSAFLAAGGYDEKLCGPEDWDLHERVRANVAQIARIDAYIQHDEGLMRLWPLLAKKFYYAQTLPAYMAKHPELGRKQLRLVRPAFLRHRRRLVREPVVLAGMLMLKISEAVAVASGLAYARIGR